MLTVTEAWLALYSFKYQVTASVKERPIGFSNSEQSKASRFTESVKLSANVPRLAISDLLTEQKASASAL
jgi:hypothetical protein